MLGKLHFRYKPLKIGPACVFLMLETNESHWMSTPEMKRLGKQCS